MMIRAFRPAAALVLLAALVAGCAPQLPIHKPEPPKPEPTVYRTLDGRVFATEAERSRYLRARAAERENDLRRVRRQGERQRHDTLSALEPGTGAGSLDGIAPQRTARLLQDVEAELARATKDFDRLERDLIRGADPVGRPITLAAARQDLNRSGQALHAATRANGRAQTRAAFSADFGGNAQRLRQEDILIARYAEFRQPDEPRGTFLLRIRRAGRTAIEEGGHVRDFL